MNKDSDIDKIRKIMPYKINDSFFDNLENNVATKLGLTNTNQIWKDTTTIIKMPQKRFFNLRVAIISSLVAAACTVLLFIQYSKKSSTIEMLNIVREYANLSETEQDFLMEVYEDDVFLNQ